MAALERELRMTRPFGWVACLALGFATRCAALLGQGDTAPPVAANSLTQFEQQIRPLLVKYCHDCHAGGTAEGNVAFDGLPSGEALLAERKLWWAVLKNVRAGVMPPVGESRPTAQEFAFLNTWIKTSVFQIDLAHPDPGPAVVRRLNRTEYGNTLRDLMGVEVNVEVLFPPDDSGFGFDNVGDALTVSPLLLEKYLQVAQQVVAEAVPRLTKVPAYQQFRGADFRDEQGHLRGENLSYYTPAEVARSVELADAGPYRLRFDVKTRGSFEFDPGRCRLDLLVDGQVQHSAEHIWEENAVHSQQVEMELAPGEHRLAFRLTPLVEKKVDAAAEAQRFTGVPGSVHLDILMVRTEGPVGSGKLQHPPRYERFFPRDEPPAAAGERRAYAAEVLRAFATKAFRRPVDETTLKRLVAIAEAEYVQPDKTFETGVAQAMTAVLASPRFLFRLESRPAGQPPDRAVDNASPASVTTESSTADARPEATDRYPLVDDYTLASRLSYFLWSSLPDEELMRLASLGQLRAELAAQLARMLRDPKSVEFVHNFVGQWLRARDVGHVSIDPLAVLGFQEEWDALLKDLRGRRFSPPANAEQEKARVRFRELASLRDNLNDEVRRAMRLEMESQFEYVLREDESVLDFLDCRYTFLNERLAKYYGLPPVEGSHMRRVMLPDGSPRGGVLAQGSMLLVTSNPTRTSPVKRGLFILENLLGTPAPPPPAVVPELEEAARQFEGQDPPLRRLLEAHRASALCKSCHARMDPLGIALENFDALGNWRDSEKGQPIDASGRLITGESFQDVRELKKILRANHRLDFYRCLTQKLLIYVLGRGLEDYDEQSVDLIVERLDQQGGRFGALLQGVIESAPFQRSRGPSPVGNSAVQRIQAGTSS